MPPRKKKRDGAGGDFARFKDDAFREWGEMYGFDPPWSNAHYKLLFDAHQRLGDERVRKAWRAFLACSEGFFAGHDPKKFVSQLSKFAVDAPNGGNGNGAGSIEIADRKVPLSGWYLDPTGDGRVKRVDAGKVLIVYPDDPKPNRICLHTLAGKQNEMLGEAPPGTNALIVPHCKPSNDISWRDYSR